MRGSRNAPRRPGAISRSPSTTRVRVLACAPGVDARKCELFQTSPGCEDALTTKLPTWEDADAADRGTNLDITINAAATRVNLFLEHATSAPLLLGFSANYTLCIAKTPSGAPEAWLRCSRMPNSASMMNPSLLDEEKGNGDRSDERHDRPEVGPRQGPCNDLRSRLVIVMVFQKVLDVTSRSLAPHVAVMEPADTGQRHHLRVR